MQHVDLTRAHPLTGLVHIEGAEPGDLLVVDVLDVKQRTAGSRIYFPVYAEGAELSWGDLNFSKNDDDNSFCCAIAMNDAAHLGFDLIKGGMAKYNVTIPIYGLGIQTLRSEDWQTFTD